MREVSQIGNRCLSVDFDLAAMFYLLQNKSLNAKGGNECLDFDSISRKLGHSELAIHSSLLWPNRKMMQRRQCGDCRLGQKVRCSLVRIAQRTHNNGRDT